MRKIVVDGPSKISGVINVQGSKNAMLVNLVLPLLTDDACVIENVPRISDVEVNLRILENLGAAVSWLDRHTVRIRCNRVVRKEIDPSLAVETTSSKFFVPLLIKRLGEVTTGRFRGDNIGGDRGFSKFLQQMSSLGVGWEEKEGRYRFFQRETSKGDRQINLPFPSFSATLTAILANILGEGSVELKNANQAPELDNSVSMLKRMGADLIVEENKITVRGVKNLKGIRFRNLSDHNALVTYVVAALITNGSLAVKGFDNFKLEAFWLFLKDIGASYLLESNQLTLEPSLFSLKPVGLYAYMWPYFHSDWQPLVAPLLTQIKGQSTIVDDLFESRLGYWEELRKMGARFEYFVPESSRFRDSRPHGVKVNGLSKLHSAMVTASDVRGGASLILASLVANGRTVIGDAEQIERGYEDIVGNLKRLGVRINYSVY